MNNWLKTGLLGAAGVGLLAASGGTLAAPFAGILGGEGAAAAGGTAAADAMADAGISSAVGTATPTAFVTPPVTGMYASASTSGFLSGTDLGYGTAASNSLLGGSAAPGEMAGSLAGTDVAYGGSSALANAPSADPSAFQSAMDKMIGYGKTAGNGLGKAATAYGTVSNAMGANQQQVQAPQARSVFSGAAPSIAQAAGMGGTQPAANQNMLLAQIARRRQQGY